MKKLILSIMISLAFSLFSLSIPKAESNSYVGTEGCSCHKMEIKEWKESKHAKAFKRLLPPETKKEKKKQKRLFKRLNKKLKDNEKLEIGKDYSKNKKCLPCHTTGYEKEGGFKDMESTSQLSGVGCEMCHGPGRDYAKLHKDKELNFTRAEAKKAGAVYGSEDEKVCKKCHENPDSPIRADVDEKYKFDWKEFLSLDKTFHKVYPLKGKH